MATFVSSSAAAENSTVIKDYCCTICNEQSVEIQADFYCKTCLKFFCATCIIKHRQHRWLFNTQPFGRDEIMKWPLSKKMEQSLLTCAIHKEKQLTLFCYDDSQLCCSSCQLNHRQCSKVVHISKIKRQSPDPQKLSVKLINTCSQMRMFQTYHENIMESIKDSYCKHESLMVQRLRKSVLDLFENSTGIDMKEDDQFTVNAMRQNIEFELTDFEKNTDNEKRIELKRNRVSLRNMIRTCKSLQSDLLGLQESIQKVENRSELFFIACRKCLSKIQECDTYIKKNFPNHVITIQGMSSHNISKPSDLSPCHIASICVLPNGQILLADWRDKKVLLLNPEYQTMCHYYVSVAPWEICQITPNEVAVTVNDGNTHEVQFMTVNQGQLVAGRKLELNHGCGGIAHHQGYMFITYLNTLYKYTVGGKQISQLYQDTSDMYTVYSCAVSNTGDRVYVTNPDQHKLLTLASDDGSLLASFTDFELREPRGVHLTSAGQVLVCGGASHTIIQVDREGGKKLATLAAQKDGVWYPWSICYNSITSSIIVGQYWNNSILVFKVQ